MRTRDRMYCQTIRSVRDISRDDKARIATCSLRTQTDRLMENYRIDIIILLKSVCLSVAVDSYRPQFLLDRLGRCFKRFVSTIIHFSHAFTFQFGLANFLYAKNLKTDCSIDHQQHIETATT